MTTPVASKTPYRVSPYFESIPEAVYRIDGVAGDRIVATVDGWLLPAPDANPALTEMLADCNRATN